MPLPEWAWRPRNDTGAAGAEPRAACRHLLRRQAEFGLRAGGAHVGVMTLAPPRDRARRKISRPRKISGHSRSGWTLSTVTRAPRLEAPAVFLARREVGGEEEPRGVEPGEGLEHVRRARPAETHSKPSPASCEHPQHAGVAVRLERVEDPRATASSAAQRRRAAARRVARVVDVDRPALGRELQQLARGGRATTGCGAGPRCTGSPEQLAPRWGRTRALPALGADSRPWSCATSRSLCSSSTTKVRLRSLADWRHQVDLQLLERLEGTARAHAGWRGCCARPATARRVGAITARAHRRARGRPAGGETAGSSSTLAPGSSETVTLVSEVETEVDRHAVLLEDGEGVGEEADLVPHARCPCEISVMPLRRRSP